MYIAGSECSCPAGNVEHDVTGVSLGEQFESAGRPAVGFAREHKDGIRSLRLVDDQKSAGPVGDPSHQQCYRNDSSFSHVLPEFMRQLPTIAESCRFALHIAHLDTLPGDLVHPSHRIRTSRMLKFSRKLRTRS